MHLANIQTISIIRNEVFAIKKIYSGHLEFSLLLIKGENHMAAIWIYARK